MAVNHVFTSVNFPLDATGSIPAGLLGQGHVAEAAVGLARNFVVCSAALDVASNEEAHKEVGQRGEVQNIQPDGKGLVGGRNTGLRHIRSLGYESRFLGDTGGNRVQCSRAEDELLERVEAPAGSGHGGISGCGWQVNSLGSDLGDGNGSDVSDERVEDGIRRTHDELGDLHSG